MKAGNKLQNGIEVPINAVIEIHPVTKQEYYLSGIIDNKKYYKIISTGVVVVK